MKEKLLLLLFLMLSITALCQSNLVASGGDAMSAGGSFSFSIGQIDYASTSVSSGSIYQGIQQPFEFFISGMDEINFVNIEVFPNPTNGEFFISSKSVFEQRTFQVLDISGKVIVSDVLNLPTQTVDLTGLSAGIYFLRIVSENSRIRTIKILKN